MKATECCDGCEIGVGGRVGDGERGRDCKKCNEWQKWVEETGSRAKKPQRRSGGRRGYRYTVFLGETIITMSNGSSHRSLPQPSTVISRTFFSSLDLMSGDQGSHILHAEHVLLLLHPPSKTLHAREQVGTTWVATSSSEVGARR